MARQAACEPLCLVEDLSDLCHCSQNLDALEQEFIAEVIDAASDFVQNLRPHYPMGRCVTTLRPCSDRCCGCDPCGCCELRGVRIEGINPTIVEVLIDGEVVPDNTYTIVTDPAGRKFLERFNLDGTPRSFPGCQNLSTADDQPGSFVVRVETGFAPDVMMRLATAEIACDMLAPFMDAVGRVLPPDTQTVAGQGFVLSSRRPGEEQDYTDSQIANYVWLQRLLAAIDGSGVGKGTRVWFPGVDGRYQNFTR